MTTRYVWSILMIYSDFYRVNLIFRLFEKMHQNVEYFVKEFLKENMRVWLTLWIELSQRVLVLRHPETVRLKGLDAYYSNFDMSYVIEYSMCEYYIICVGDALFGLKWWFLARFCFLSHIWVVWSTWNVTQYVQRCL